MARYVLHIHVNLAGDVIIEAGSLDAAKAKIREVDLAAWVNSQACDCEQIEIDDENCHEEGTDPG